MYNCVLQRLTDFFFPKQDFADKWAEAVQQLKKGVEDGKITVGDANEHVVETKFEDVPKTWLLLFEGANQGKLLTKITQ